MQVEFFWLEEDEGEKAMEKERAKKRTRYCFPKAERIGTSQKLGRPDS